MRSHLRMMTAIMALCATSSLIDTMPSLPPPKPPKDTKWIEQDRRLAAQKIEAAKAKRMRKAQRGAR